MNKASLARYLIDRYVPLHKWRESGREVDDLAEKVEAGVILVKSSQSRGVIFICKTAEIRVLSQDQERILAVGHMMSGNRRIECADTAGASLSSPIKDGENPSKVASKAIKSFFSIYEFKALTLAFRGKKTSSNNDAYPGTCFIHAHFSFDWVMPRIHYKDHYVEGGWHGADKTYYQWIDRSDLISLPTL